VAAAVAYSPKITALNATVQAELPNAVNDLPWHLYGTNGENGCYDTKSCVYDSGGNAGTIILLGDSHAMMWLPAVVPWATAHHFRVLLLWERGCPIAELPTAYSFNGTADNGKFTNSQCNGWAAKTIKAVDALHVKLVLVGERTTGVYSIPSDIPFTQTQWQDALGASLKKLNEKGTHVAVIEDAPWHNTDVPQCLAAEPTNVQSCSVPFPNTDHPGYQVAEALAAQATGTNIILTSYWMCTKTGTTCSSVIGNYITYRDAGHVSASYAYYLSGVMGHDLQKLV
jgi:hypothetical protein